MTKFLNYINDLEIQTVSESESARIRISKARSIEIELDPRCPSHISEAELASDIEAAVQDARREYSLAIHELKLENQNSRNRNTTPSRTQEEKRERYLTEISTIECTSKSQRGLVTATFYGDGDMIIQIMPNTFNRVGSELNILSRELESAIKSGIEKRSHELQLAHRKAYS